MEKQKSALLILDGWGHGMHPKADAIRLAKTPFVDNLYRDYPSSELVTFGEEVGLPEGQMGNSEVGHLNIGAGRIVYQDLARINKAIADEELANNKVLVDAMHLAKSKKVNFHLMGLLSDGGVHSHINHLKALCNITQDNDLSKIYIHAFTDGRDTDPKAGLSYLEELQNHIENTNIKLATIIGRYYAMDRDNRWDRIMLAYDALVHRMGNHKQNFLEAVQESYNNDVTDEFIKPIICTKDKGAIKAGDVVLFFNFRTDRPRQLTNALSQESFKEFESENLQLDFFTMTKYDNSFKGIKVLFEKDDIKLTLGEYLQKKKRTQLRIAETEKYPHVTFFFSGGREKVFNGESRILIPSPKVATYDEQPEMSADEITQAVIANVEEEKPDFICLNYANTDMVGHTGDFDACMRAAEKVDSCLQKLIPVLLENNYNTVIIADHGNSDFMINEDGSPNTAHSTNLVPCFLVSEDLKNAHLENGKLADIAPTILYLMGLEKPKEMTGKNLIRI